MNKLSVNLVGICLLSLSSISLAKSVQVCSAENFYGNIAEMIGGRCVEVSNIISNPNADPHLFSISSETARAITKAQVIIYNGLDYDAWMMQLLAAQACNNKLAIINVAELVGIKKGSNPHIWYNPRTFPVLAKLLADKFSAIQPENKLYFEENLKSFTAKYKVVLALISDIRLKYSGISVTATEPVFNYMSDALEFDMKSKEFQQVIMNGSEPSPKMTADFTSLIKDKKVKILFYNNQVTNSTSEYVLNLAREKGLFIVGVSETMPVGKNVIEWLTSELEELQKVLK